MTFIVDVTNPYCADELVTAWRVEPAAASVGGQC